MMSRLIFLFFVLHTCSNSLWAVPGFENVAEILEQNCVKCHHEGKDKGDLRLDTLEWAKKGGESGSSLVPGQPDESELLNRVKLEADHDDIMPPKGEPLTANQIQALETWIILGAKWPEGKVLVAPEDKPVKKAEPLSRDFARVKSDLNDEDFFRKEVFPIVDEHCYKCHGHDHEKMKADFWMASRMNILKGGSLGPVIDLEKPNHSEMLELIHGFDEERIMPPKTTLSDREKAILTEWVYRGVPFDKDLEHVYVKQNEVNDENRKFWSFQPVENKKPTEVKNKAWVKSDLDQYILSQLELKHMQPAAPADKVSLLRRVYYNLTGLPPSVSEVEAFVNNDDPKAYEQLIDQLLASKHYGEKWGRHWMDLVRFAETNGYERDGAKPEAYKYRQYVIDAFNQDKPYDQMILEQLAGDEINPSDKEKVTATGFYRLHIWDDEPADREQAIYDEYDDMLRTTTEVFMGLTVGCARCHDHKIDPIPQKDYYRMLSFFTNIKPFVRGNRANVKNMASSQLQNKFEEENKKLRAERARLGVELKGLQQEFLQALEMKPLVSDMKDIKFKFYRDTWDRLPDFEMERFEEEGSLSHNYFDLSHASRKTAFAYVFEGKIIVPATAYYTFQLRADDGARLLIDGKVVIDHNGKNTLKQGINKRVHLPEGELSIRLEYFQKEGDYGLSLNWSGQGLFSFKPLTLPRGKAATADVVSLMTNGRGPLYKVQPIVRERLGKEKADRVNKIYKLLHENRDRVAEDFVLCVEEKGVTPASTHVLARGSAHAKGPKVKPAFLSILPEVIPQIQPKGQTSGRRLALGQWFADKSHPLTARVMVNRIWQYHFGRGLVRSSSDYGFMGTPPTHPELLDHLAHKFMHEFNWSIKAMHKYIMLTSTYQMSSKSNSKYLSIDPDNDYFWRFNMQRLTAEDIRDSILKVTGQLDVTYGGPSVYPKISQEVLSGQSKVTNWKIDKAYDPDHQHRRTVYAFNKRSLVLPFIEGMDGPTTDTSCAVRFVTTQPTQSLTMLNSDFLREASEDLKEYIVSENKGDRREQIKSIWLKVTGRDANEEVIQEGLKFFRDFKQSGADEDLALQQFCLIALNLNEFIYLD